jgi:hypothetical protein
MRLGKQADGEGMAFDLRLRDVSFNYQVMLLPTLHPEGLKRA